ncbi:MAG: hypothetical protein NTZ38_02810 [Candidatus Taylorbacteria bacterium]|nr:hypothetical protein [Candidatus Taylorbacteria bacterium]
MVTKLTHSKLIISGSTIESYEYKERSLTYGFSNRKGKSRRKIVVIDEATKQKKIESRKRSMQRSNSKLRRLVNANAWKWTKPDGTPYPPVFATFTFKENIKDIKVANRIFSHFVKRLNYELGHTKKSFLKYITVIEFQDFSRDGVVHYHSIFFNLEFIRKDILADIWGQGFVHIRAIDQVNNAGAYVSKYLVKHFEDDRLDGQKRYFSSRGLLKPIEILDQFKADSISSLIPAPYLAKQKEFTSKYQGKVEYKQYLLERTQSINDVVPDLDLLI